MLRFTLLTCLIAFAATSQVFAQQMEDVVYLKNGGVVRGTIIEEVVGKSLKIKTRDGNVFVYTMDEIDKMSREPVMGIRGIGGQEKNPSVKSEIGTLFSLRHLRSSYWYDTRTTNIVVPSALSFWLIPTEMAAIGSEILFASIDTDVAFLLTGKVAFSPSYTSTPSIYVLGTGSLTYDDRSTSGAGVGMGLRARIGPAFVLRMEGRYERWFENEENIFSLLFGLGTELGG